MQVRVGDVISNTDRRDPRPPAAVTAVIPTQRTNTVRCRLVVLTAHKNGASDESNGRESDARAWRKNTVVSGRFQRATWTIPSRRIWKMDSECVARPEGISSGGCRQTRCESGVIVVQSGVVNNVTVLEIGIAKCAPTSSPANQMGQTGEDGGL